MKGAKSNNCLNRVRHVSKTLSLLDIDHKCTLYPHILYITDHLEFSIKLPESYEKLLKTHNLRCNTRVTQVLQVFIVS
jgi:hypothetical protein